MTLSTRYLQKFETPSLEFIDLETQAPPPVQPPVELWVEILNDATDEFEVDGATAVLSTWRVEGEDPQHIGDLNIAVGFEKQIDVWLPEDRDQLQCHKELYPGERGGWQDDDPKARDRPRGALHPGERHPRVIKWDEVCTVSRDQSHPGNLPILARTTRGSGHLLQGPRPTTTNRRWNAPWLVTANCGLLRRGRGSPSQGPEKAHQGLSASRLTRFSARRCERLSTAVKGGTGLWRSRRPGTLPSPAAKRSEARRRSCCSSDTRKHSQTPRFHCYTTPKTAGNRTLWLPSPAQTYK